MQMTKRKKGCALQVNGKQINMRYINRTLKKQVFLLQKHLLNNYFV